MYNIIPAIAVVLFLPLSASAQFYTITKEAALTCEKVAKSIPEAGIARDTALLRPYSDSIAVRPVKGDGKHSFARKGYDSTSRAVKVEKPVLRQPVPRTDGLPELTIPNLYAEIIRNGIRHPKVVLAQAILETGWFTSSVCRNKHNLFGLTNPRTGKYFEFSHWTESVRAYYTMVQYRYKGGNYLLWLHKIGYAEDKRYIPALVNVLKIL